MMLMFAKNGSTMICFLASLLISPETIVLCPLVLAGMKLEKNGSSRVFLFASLVLTSFMFCITQISPPATAHPLTPAATSLQSRTA